MNTLVLIRKDLERAKCGRDELSRFWGLEGEAWRIEPLEEPPFPVQPATVADWISVARHTGHQIVCVTDGDIDVSSEDMHGYDVAWINEEWQIYSATVNDLLVRDLPELVAYRDRLNRFGLFDRREDANAFCAHRQRLLEGGVDLETDSEWSRIQVLALYCPKQIPEDLRFHPLPGG